MKFTSGGWLRTALVVPALVAMMGLGACHGRRMAPQRNAESDGNAMPRRGAALAVVDLSRGVPDGEPSGLLALRGRSITFDELLRTLKETRGHKDTKGYFVKFGMANVGLSHAVELGQMLAEIRAGGLPIHCHADALTNTTLYLAARGCSKIVVAPGAEVSAVGMGFQIVYLRKLLMDELHVSVDWLQVGKSKGASEPYLRDGPSDEARASLEGTLSRLRDVWLKGVVEGRDKKDLAQTAEDGPYGADGALARGLIDGIDYGDGAREAARKAVGAIRDDVVFGGAGTADGRESFADVVRMLGGEPTRHGPIALVKAVGGIRMAGGGGPFGGGGGITEKELGRVLARIEDADAIKAVVLRIDSPGGSALASDLLWHALMKVRAKKPVVVSVGEMAASGGYYLACTGNVIFATPGSIVGSIGVVGGKFGVGAALERWGVHAETFSGKRGDVAHANRATYDSALGAWDEPTKKRMLEQMESTYDLFLRRVAEGRRLPIETVRGFAEGKIFSGEEGQELHMVDELGGLEAAIVRARELAGLPSDAAVEVVGARPSLTDTLFGDSPFGGGDGEGRAPWAARLGAWALGAPMGPSEPALASSTRALWDAVASLGNAEHMATVLPFWLKGP